jgi:hypothetical protein
MALDDKLLENVDESDLRLLIEGNVPEGRRIEHKERLNIETSDERKKFLKHVCSLANASGGHLVFGMKAEKGIASELCGLELEDPDRTKLRVIQLVRDGIVPRLTALSVHTTHLSDGKYVLILRVPKGWNGPYAVKDECRFYSRHGAGAYLMDYSEIRSAFLQTAALEDRLKAFRDQRLTVIHEGRAPFKSPEKTHAIAHIIPFQAFQPGFQINWDIITKNQITVCPFYAVGGNFGYILEGHLTWLQDFNSQRCDNYTLVFRNGIIEAVETRLFEPLKNVTQLDGPLIAASLVKWVEGFIQASARLGISFPFMVSYGLIGVADFTLRTSLTHHLSGSARIDRNELLLPEIVINEIPPTVTDSLKPILDGLWNAGGFSECKFQREWL